jgi:branched-subunit amino acid transport protein
MTDADLRVWLIIALLTAIVVVMRNVFLFVPRSWQPRGLLQQALRYAPLAALAALVAPEILSGVRASGVWSAASLADPRLASAFVLIAVTRLSGSAFAGLAAGMLVFLILLPA